MTSLKIRFGLQIANFIFEFVQISVILRFEFRLRALRTAAKENICAHFFGRTEDAEIAEIRRAHK